jgi:hypothetical protein
VSWPMRWLCIVERIRSLWCWPPSANEDKICPIVWTEISLSRRGILAIEPLLCAALRARHHGCPAPLLHPPAGSALRLRVFAPWSACLGGSTAATQSAGDGRLQVEGPRGDDPTLPASRMRRSFAGNSSHRPVFIRCLAA